MSDLSKYKDSLGVPGQGVHKHVGGIAIYDVVGTIGVSYGISKLTGWSFATTVVSAFVIGEIAHHMFSVDTAVMRMLGFDHSKPESDSDQKRKCPMSAFQ
jgi:hypothetical protein